MSLLKGRDDAKNEFGSFVDLSGLNSLFAHDQYGSGVAHEMAVLVFTNFRFFL